MAVGLSSVLKTCSHQSSFQCSFSYQDNTHLITLIYQYVLYLWQNILQPGNLHKNVIFAISTFHLSILYLQLYIKGGKAIILYSFVFFYGSTHTQNTLETRTKKWGSHSPHSVNTNLLQNKNQIKILPYNFKFWSAFSRQSFLSISGAVFAIFGRNVLYTVDP